ncbi:outer dynein arm-docking complex subunit 4 isoform X2 [Periplaneta americana]|uniref:outer dynein arm-docking complex subunit 4 isoform X2 n=1 Tax=Periplaneta americana TaxID=6978 RepID=UPI0037E899E8
MTEQASKEPAPVEGSSEAENQHKKTSKLSEHAQEILKLTRDTEFLQSFLRVNIADHEGDDSDRPRQRGGKKAAEEPPPLLPPIQQIQQQQQLQQEQEEQRRQAESAAMAAAAAERRREAERRKKARVKDEEEPSAGKTTFSQLTKDLKLRKGPKRGRRRSRGRRQEECYTDKDRAAAVNMGSHDIKQSLKMKRRQDRTKALQIPEEAEPGTLLALGSREMRSGDVSIAINFVHKALELNPKDKNALVARSKCYLLLGEPQLALKDAETALHGDKNFIHAIYQKAESLYNLGDFEHSLMYYHRGLHLRPELEGFRLGVQKAQEAIENTIGNQLPQAEESNTGSTESNGSAKRASSCRKSEQTSQISKQQSRRLLGELCVDKEYLEQFLKHPDIKCMNHEDDRSQITLYAKEGVEFLNRRQEFWRQQQPNTTTTRKLRKQ